MIYMQYICNIYVYIYENLPRNAIVRLHHPRSRLLSYIFLPSIYRYFLYSYYIYNI